MALHAPRAPLPRARRWRPRHQGEQRREHEADEQEGVGEGGGEETSARLSTLVGADVPLLGKIPFAPELRTGGDNGAPIVHALPDSPTAVAIMAIADKLVIRDKSLLGVRLGISS